MHGPPGPQAPLPAGEAVLIGLAALAVMLIPFLWPLVDHFYTMGHEGTHAAFASLLGFPLAGVIVNADNEGLTSYYGSDGPRRVLVSFSGYLGPSAFGVAAAKLISLGQPVTVLWLAVVLLGLLLFLIRKSFGILSVPAVITLIAVVLHNGHARTEVIAAYAMAWLLLLSGLRIAAAHGADAGDAYTLNEVTHLPRRLWALLWLAGTFAALLYGGRLLVLGR